MTVGQLAQGLGGKQGASPPRRRARGAAGSGGPSQVRSLLFTDPPRHRQLRKLINSGFTRRHVAILEPKIREIVRAILDRIEPTN